MEGDKVAREMIRLDWGIIVSLAMSAASLLFTGGVVYGQVQAHDVRLVKVEAKTEAQQSDSAEIKASLAEIKAILRGVEDRAREDRSAMNSKR